MHPEALLKAPSSESFIYQDRRSNPRPEIRPRAAEPASNSEEDTELACAVTELGVNESLTHAPAAASQGPLRRVEAAGAHVTYCLATCSRVACDCNRIPCAGSLQRCSAARPDTVQQCTAAASATCQAVALGQFLSRAELAWNQDDD